MFKIALILAVAIIVTLIVLAILYAATTHRIEVIGFDTVALPGESCSIRIKVERKIWPVYPDLQGATVSLYHDGTEQTKVTDKFGTAEFQTTAPAKEGVYAFRYTAKTQYTEISEGAARIFVLSEHSPVIVTDIDKTISDATEFEFLLRANSEIHPFEDCSDVLGKLGGQYQIFYITARDDRFANKTFEWLRLHKFPAGPIFFRNITFRTVSAYQYKLKVVGDLISKWKGIRWGIGDREEDMRCYAKYGIKAIRFRLGNGNSEYSTVHSWKEIGKKISESI